MGVDIYIDRILTLSCNWGKIGINTVISGIPGFIGGGGGAMDPTKTVYGRLLSNGIGFRVALLTYAKPATAKALAQAF